MLTSPQATVTATVRTLYIWLLTNIGGTGWLVMDFCRDSVSDVAVPLIIGLVAALVSLAAVPFAIPLFVMAERFFTGWRCRIIALIVVVIGFSVGNYLLLNFLPIGPYTSLLSMSQPYLVATVQAVMWLYRPRPVFQPAHPGRVLAGPPRPTPLQLVQNG